PLQAAVDAGYAPPSTASADTVRSAYERLASLSGTAGGGASGYLGLRSPAQASELLARMAELAGGVEPVLSQVDKYLRREDSSDRLESVDGPFTGDPSAAVGTAHMWLSEAAVAAEKLQQALHNAQIATSGLARSADR